MRYLVVIILLLGLAAVSPVNIETQTHAYQKQGESKQKLISKRRAIQAAQREVKGKVLSASLINSKGPAVYRVKMLVGEKRVRTVFVDGVTARVIRIN